MNGDNGIEMNEPSPWEETVYEAARQLSEPSEQAA
jgi:hypothetical protein